jgi:hypothetical protein
MNKVLTGTFLVLLGCVFLLVNLGYISWEAAEQLARLWPLLLVAWGIGLIARGSRLAFLGFLGPLLLVLALFYVIWRDYYGPNENMRSIKVSQELTDIDEANVTLKFAGGTLSVKAGDTLDLIEADLGYRADSSSPRLEYYEEDGMGYASLRRRGGTHSGPGLGNRWDVCVTDQIPIDMKVVSEGASCALNLDGVQIVSLDLSSAASSVKARLGVGDLDGSIRVDAGVSSVRLEIPKQYGIRLVMGCDLCWKHLPDGMKKRPGGVGAYYSKNYDSAPYRMDVEIDAGLSTVTIEQY